MTTTSQIPELLNKYFPRPLSVFNITSAIQKSENQYAYQIKYQNANCLNIIITLFNDKNHIKNIYLKKLDGARGSGTQNLKLLEAFAASFGYSIPILLIDESYITIGDKNISLKYLSLLKSGKSWYNTLGYISANYDEEQYQNERAIQTPFMTALPHVIENLETGDNREIYTAFITSIMDPIVNPDGLSNIIDIVRQNLANLDIKHIDTIKVKSVFKQIHQIMKMMDNSDSVRKITFIYAIVMAFRYGSSGTEFTILYDNQLLKMVEPVNIEPEI